MHPYTQRYFEELITTGGISAVTPSGVWYESRPDFGPEQLGVPLVSHRDRGFELLQGPGRFSGKILGGCIDTLFDIFDGERYGDMPPLCEKYGLFPSLADWKGRILLLESSEEKMPPEKYRRALHALKATGIFSVISGVLVGKPMDEAYAEEYKRLLVEVVAQRDLPIVFNLNIGHAMPRCIMPFGVDATVDVEHQIIYFGNAD
jgi:muramoyltetrapeptide carboxypeptidase LdcA involved in peptidoglycan recycling